MDALERRCRRLPFFRSLEPAGRAALIAAGAWFSLPGGACLFDAGAPSQTLYFLLGGRLIVVRPRPDETDDSSDVVGYVRAGEPVGEMSLLSGEPHSASVFALRDSEILAVPRAAVEALLEADPRLAAGLARAVLARARHPRASFAEAPPRVFALVASSPSIPIGAVAEEVGAELRRIGRRVRVLPEDVEPGEAFGRMEKAVDALLLPCRIGESGRYRFALRHADRFFVFARQDARPPTPLPLAPDGQAVAARRFRLVDLVAVHEGRRTGCMAAWAEAVDAARIFHWGGPAGRAADCNRLARAIAGLTLGLVLSGGGARAYAHVGVLRALRSRGLPVDFVAGASMGAVIGACIAMGWTLEETERRIREAFVASDPLSDYVLPVVAMTRGRLVEERLKAHFGDVAIEELALPFACVSAELTAGRLNVHRRGRLRDALRATISLPGVLPPVVDDGRVLVDGAAIDNLPTGLMTGLHRGVTLAVDVARRDELDPAAFRDPPGFLTWVRRNGLRATPPIVSLLMRAATMRPDAPAAMDAPDILIAPAADGVALRDWKRYDLAVADGEAAAEAALAAHSERLDPIAAAAALTPDAPPPGNN